MARLHQWCQVYWEADADAAKWPDKRCPLLHICGSDLGADGEVLSWAVTGEMAVWLLCRTSDRATACLLFLNAQMYIYKALANIPSFIYCSILQCNSQILSCKLLGQTLFKLTMIDDAHKGDSWHNKGRDGHPLPFFKGLQAVLPKRLSALVSGQVVVVTMTRYSKAWHIILLIHTQFCLEIALRGLPRT